MHDDLDPLGPLDWFVVGLGPGDGGLDGPVARELAALVEAELIRILDLVVVSIADDGDVEVLELEDLRDSGPLRILEGRLAEVIAEADVDAVAAALRPAERAVLLVVAHTWAGPLIDASRRCGASMFDMGCISTTDLLAAVGGEPAGG